MYCKMCAHKNKEPSIWEEGVADSRSTTPELASSGSKTTKILITVVIIMVAVLGIGAAMLLTYQSPAVNTTANNTTAMPQNTTMTGNQAKSTNNSLPTSIVTSNGKSVDLTDYQAVDVREDTATGNIRCRVCDQWTVTRKVTEYKNSAGERIMIGENYCTKCGSLSKEYWQNGKWYDLKNNVITPIL
jgi:hypothetical protein